MTAITVGQHFWARLLVCLLLLLPGFLLFLLPEGGDLAEGYWLLILFVLCFWVMLLSSICQPEGGAAAVHAKEPPVTGMFHPEEPRRHD